MTPSILEQIKKKAEGKCGAIYDRREFKDVSGCIKEKCHNDFHICITNDEKIMAWEDDYGCTCGCWDEYENGDTDVCRVYWEIKDPELLTKYFENQIK